MTLSVFDIFKVGIGPSSSHTVGPMRAARNFARNLNDRGVLDDVVAMTVELYGSLAETGRGHGTDMGIMLGLSGESPDTVVPSDIAGLIAHIKAAQELRLWGKRPIKFDPDKVFSYRIRPMVEHPNGMRFSAFNEDGLAVLAERYVSIGGGFIRALDVIDTDETIPQHDPIPFPFSTGRELLDLCQETGKSIAQIMMANEATLLPEDQVRRDVLHLADVMNACIDRGCGIGNDQAGELLPGGLKVRRRAPALYRELQRECGKDDVMAAMDWVNLFAMAVNEENAASGRVVTAPTNGAAGLLPSVLRYYQVFTSAPTPEGVVDFLLTAAAIGFLYKTNASISGAEVGCQGEIGVACSMAAAGLTAVLGGIPQQVENAAEIGMEHNLGLTCDPIGGLVQIPCIERNAMGAVKAINASRLALQGDGKHHVSLDAVIETMRQTGADMRSKYKETSRGGLAVNVVVC
ncbi:L-serine ammonia-lyase [Pollutimonas nitritireducens]|uniref:L-serine dehydratase n=1 Tax=Pollutimonas nitritireducens TaxID=2045209 RepID=A0A2N4UC58_9BURK|nr:L-serine ammonia-lyase [Pollutimonas nitritireducens]PLC52599.1 L-serine ammonia-lyase [Pollutimonas nitritireducens]